MPDHDPDQTVDSVSNPPDDAPDSDLSDRLTDYLTALNTDQGIGYTDLRFVIRVGEKVRRPDDEITVGEVRDWATTAGLDAERFDQMLNDLLKRGDLYQPDTDRDGVIRVTPAPNHPAYLGPA